VEETRYGLIQVFRDGGFMMYPLVLASLIGLGVVALVSTISTTVTS
jgi:hypothetical protein